MKAAMIWLAALAFSCVAGCSLLETGAKAPAVSVNPDFEDIAGRAAEGLLAALSKPGEAAAIADAASLMKEAADSEAGTRRRLAALYLAGVAFFKAGEIERSHDCLKELLEGDPDCSATEGEMADPAGAGGIKGVSSLAEALSGRRGAGQASMFNRVVEIETEIAFRFLAGEKRSFLGLKFLGGRAEAAEILQKMTEIAPYSPHTGQSLYELGNYFFSDGDLDKAINVYESLIRELPEDKWRAPAEYMSARCHFEKNKDIDRDTSNLDRALMRFRIFVQNNQGLEPVEISPGVRTDLLKLAEWYVNHIRGLLAEKLFRTAEYYAGDGKKAAARMYLAMILKDYHGTEWASKAKAELAQDSPEAK